MTSIINEDLIKSSLDADNDIEVKGAANPVFANAINVHNKKKKEIEKTLKDADKVNELKKPFKGIKGKEPIMPKSKEMKKMHLSESLFEDYQDCPDIYDEIFRVVGNMEHIINYINDLEDEDMTYEDMQQSYNVLDDAMDEFKGYLEEIQKAERTGKNESLKEATTFEEPKTRADWIKLDKKLNKDIWSSIYNELNGELKGIDAKFRKLKRKPSERYSEDQLSTQGEIINVQAKSEDEFAFAKEVADTYGVQYDIQHRTGKHYEDAPYVFKIYTNKPVDNGMNESIKKNAKKVNAKQLKEAFYRGAKGVEFVGHGEWADPELIYNGYSFNYWDIEDALWDGFLDETGYSDAQSDDPKVEEEFNTYVKERCADYLDDCIYGGAFTGLSIEGDMIDFPNGEYYYVGYEDGKISLDNAYNTGRTPEYSIDYDFEESIDTNLQKLYDHAIEKSPWLNGDDDDIDESLKENKVEHKYIMPLKDKVLHCYSVADLEEQGADLSQLSDKDIDRILEGTIYDSDIEKMFGGISFVDDDFGIVDKRKAPHRKSNTQRRNDKMHKMFDDANKKPMDEDLKIVRESDLTDFEFWSGARDTVKYLTDDEIRTIAQYLEDTSPDGMTDTEVNDFFWFEDDLIAEWLGYNSFEEIMNRDNDEE